MKRRVVRRRRTRGGSVCAGVAFLLLLPWHSPAQHPPAETFPPWKQFEMQPKDEVQFRLKGGGKDWKWTVNGKPSGAGDAFVLKPSGAGKMVVRGVGVDAKGQPVEHSWEVDVRGAASGDGARSAPRRVAPKPAAVAKPGRRAPRDAASDDDATPDAVAAVPTPAPESPAPASPPAAAPPKAAGPTSEDVRGLIDSYADAYRKRDIDALRRIGQVTNDQQAAQMRDYFAKTPDLDVDVQILDVSRDGDKTKVRFTRRDRFKTPAGQEVSQETPPIEKEIVESDGQLKLRAPQE